LKAKYGNNFSNAMVKIVRMHENITVKYTYRQAVLKNIKEGIRIMTKGPKREKEIKFTFPMGGQWYEINYGSLKIDCRENGTCYSLVDSARAVIESANRKAPG
jgi:hypothetical protein